MEIVANHPGKTTYNQCVWIPTSYLKIRQQNLNWRENILEIGRPSENEMEGNKRAAKEKESRQLAAV